VHNLADVLDKLGKTQEAESLRNIYLARRLSIMALKRPRMALRVGVTGHRKLDVTYALRARVRDVLQMLQAATAEILVVARSFYAEGPPLFRAVSSLAEGADRLFAEEALSLGFELDCPLPFSQAEYEKDFPTRESVEEFRGLLSRATGRVLELDGPTRAEERSGAYESVGRSVLDRSEMLVAIWDGEPAKGAGGTGHIVEIAQRKRTPILWIHPKTGAVVLKLRGAETTLTGDVLRDQLEPIFNRIGIQRP